MAFHITDHHARYLRLSSQRLVCTPSSRPIRATQVLKQVIGVQAQELDAAFLSIHARTAGLGAASVEHELLSERSVVRSWLMRGTLHLVAAQDIDWLLPLLAPIFIKNNRRRYKELGLGDPAIARGVEIIQKQLASQGPMTRHQLAAYLKDQGVNTDGQALIYLINRAAWEGVLCLGPEIDGKQAYVLLSEWIGRDLSKRSEGGYGLLAERFLAAYGPAGPKDFASWSGLPSQPVKEAWKSLEDRLVELEFPGGSGFILSDQASRLDEPAAHSLGIFLLPRFDTFLLGYADRSLFVAPEHVKRINAGGGILKPVLLVEGRVQGVWRLVHERNRLQVQVEPFTRLSSDDLDGLDAQVKHIGQFLEAETQLQMKQ